MKVSIGIAANCNSQWRRTMEDTHVYLHDFGGVSGQTYMAVFDGHAGKFAAEWCRDNFHDILATEMKTSPDAPIPEILNATFLRADEQLTRESQISSTRSGCTAVVALLREESDADGLHKMLYVANVGDARAVLRHGESAIRLTYDHKGSDPLETERVTARGGFVHGNRVNGILAVTRSLGDYPMKDYIVGAPFTSAIRLGSEDSLLVVACDGLWDVTTDQKATDIATQHDTDASAAAQALLDDALANYSTDNITVLVARLNI
ncbi:protein-serine/threonine phosphatase [Malassezia cuniculi]|uniref:Protein-serine/threonine phosphatase n=1 Tax=Malassezia cuniculi TaxID=948313 RepID=A0AAF0EXC4_9BASI|nr:protein-serine/threonine phosphatase [Malassezia cuniculi]